NDAIAFFKLRADDATSGRDKRQAIMAVKEFATGRDMLDLLIDARGEAFLVPESADTVTQSLMNYYAVLDRKQFPLLSWRVLDALIQSRTAPCLSESEAASCPPQALH
ncbi:hypothetical protein, partial [Methylobacterium nigriterrae]|uniref:hypothetical protein n=1 Tax=Methylobacterium nigriterrae TaxID=3127512 RepID=UPI00301349EB